MDETKFFCNKNPPSTTKAEHWTQLFKINFGEDLTTLSSKFNPNLKAKYIM